jgi:hypothetical protein
VEIAHCADCVVKYNSFIKKDDRIIICKATRKRGGWKFCGAKI